MTIFYYCIECGKNMSFEDLKVKNLIRIKAFFCPHCDNDKFEIYDR